MTQRLSLLVAVLGMLTLAALARQEPEPEQAPVGEAVAHDHAWPDPADRVELSPQAWRERLTERQFYVLREAGTERPYSHAYHKQKDEGFYACAGCGNLLFTSGAKFDSRTGWPSFYEPAGAGHVIDRPDPDGTGRTETLCARCGGHLGHVFEDGYGTPTGLRYCMNGTALLFHPLKK